jgi:hypothetical protein
MGILSLGYSGITKLCFLPRFWSGMYNRFEKGMQPRQSVTDYLMAVKEESQQLEEELEALEEVRRTCYC